MIPAAPWLQALRFEKDDLVQALGMSFTTSTIALTFSLALHQVWEPDQLALSALAVVPALIGRRAGQILRPAVFRRGYSTPGSNHLSAMWETCQRHRESRAQPNAFFAAHE